MAREGSGHAQFITGTDRMQPKVRPAVKTDWIQSGVYSQASRLRQVMQSLRFALQPAVDNISVNWTVPEGVTVTCCLHPSMLCSRVRGRSSTLRLKDR